MNNEKQQQQLLLPLLVGGSLFVLCTIALSQMEVGVASAANTIRDVDFNSPFDNNTYDLGTSLH
jgi:hypothetical protein